MRSADACAIGRPRTISTADVLRGLALVHAVHVRRGRGRHHLLQERVRPGHDQACVQRQHCKRLGCRDLRQRRLIPRIFLLISSSTLSIPPHSHLHCRCRCFVHCNMFSSQRVPVHPTLITNVDAKQPSKPAYNYVSLTRCLRQKPRHTSRFAPFLAHRKEVAWAAARMTRVQWAMRM